MSETPNSSERAGWEHIWRSENPHPRYQTFAPPNTTVVEWADTLPAGAYILDVGCGIGRHLVYLGGRGFRMAGLDISPTGIQLSQAVCEERGIPFDGKVAEMTVFPWADVTFDAVFSTSTIHHNRRADMVRSFAEIWRVLKPGGLLLVDLLPTARPDYQRLRSLVATGEILEVEPHTFVDERPDSEDEDGFLPHHYSDEADVRDLLSAFNLLKLWISMRTAQDKPDTIDKWVVWAQKPL